MNKTLDSQSRKAVIALSILSIISSAFSQIDNKLINFIRMNNKAAVLLIALGIITLIFAFINKLAPIALCALAYFAACLFQLQQFTQPGQDRYFGGGGSLVSLLLGVAIGLVTVVSTEYFFQSKQASKIQS